MDLNKIYIEIFSSVNQLLADLFNNALRNWLDETRMKRHGNTSATNSK
jgi:hypothetical protein